MFYNVKLVKTVKRCEFVAENDKSTSAILSLSFYFLYYLLLVVRRKRNIYFKLVNFLKILDKFYFQDWVLSENVFKSDFDRVLKFNFPSFLIDAQKEDSVTLFKKFLKTLWIKVCLCHFTVKLVDHHVAHQYKKDGDQNYERSVSTILVLPKNRRIGVQSKYLREVLEFAEINRQNKEKSD